MKAQRLMTMLNSLTTAQINTFTLSEPTPGIRQFQGALIVNILKEYGLRYTLESDLPFAWNKYAQLANDNFWRAYDALTAEYDPISNYDMTEELTAQEHDGDITHTRSTDDQHNTITTAIEQDITAKVTASDTNKPTSKHYTTTYDNDNTGRLASYDVNSGETETHTTTAPNSNSSTVTDDLTETNTETHTQTTATVNGSTITADKITGHKLTRKGNIGVTTAQQMIESEMILRTKILLYDFINRFVERYTFYAGCDYIEYECDNI